MAGKLSNYQYGLGGVNLSKDPLHLGDDEATQLQNAELVTDANRGGQGSLSKRGGLATFTTAMAGSILGIIGLPLKTTFTRTLYAGLGTAASTTWARTTDGTTFTTTSTPYRPTTTPDPDYNTVGVATFSGDRRMVGYKTFIIYPGSDYVSDLSNPENNTALDMDMWNGTDAVKLFRLQVGSSSTDGNFAFTVTDMLKANNTIYFAVHDPVNSGAPNLNGRVLSMDVTTGVIQQVAQPFGVNTGAVTGGAPVCLAWYQGKLWVGTQGGNGSANVGKIVWCYPGIDTTWTVDSAVLPGWLDSICPYRGDLFGTVRTASSQVYRRSATTGTWATSDNPGTYSGTSFYKSLIVYGDELYVAVFSNGGTDIQQIRKFDGTSWTADRDLVTAGDLVAAQDIGNAVIFGSDLFYCFQSTTISAADGFILRKRAGTWSKVSTANYTGRMGVLLVRT